MEEFIYYLEQQIKDGREKAFSLEAEGRQDDAIFAKVRVNIYDICRTVSLALVNRPDAGVKAVKAQLDRFREGWGAALKKAKEHDDTKNIAVEEIKLAALEDILLHFQEVVKV